MSALTEGLIAQPTADEVKFTPRTEYDGQVGHIQTGPLEAAPKSHTDILELFGYDPAEVRIIGHPRVSRWQTYDERWLSAYRFQLAPVPAAEMPDIADAIRRHKPRAPSKPSGGAAFVFHACDLQLGKVDGDSIEGTVEAFLSSVDIAVEEFTRLSAHRGTSTVQLVFPGDICEGNQSQGGALMWRTVLTITEQMRMMRRLFFHVVERFAPLADVVYLDVVNGNHDEAQRHPVQTRPDDGHATEQAITVGDMLDMNPAAFGHVTVRVPPVDQHWMTVPVGNTTVTVAHGHKWRRGKAMDWLANQALHLTNVTGSQVLQHGHEHRWTVDTNAARTVICAPAFDGGSTWLGNGSAGVRGGLTYVLDEGRVLDMRVV